MQAFQSLVGMEWHAVNVGAGFALGWVRCEGDPAQAKKLEATQGVVSLKTALHGHYPVPVGAVTALAAQGVLSTDSILQAIEKVIAKVGGLTVHI
jgi:hypothetical protein